METEEKEIVEKKIYESGKKEYASRGLGNASLTLGIIGTGLSAMNLWNRGGSLFGGGSSMPENVNINAVDGAGSFGGNPSTFQVWQKENDDLLSMTNTVWGLKVNTEEQIAATRERDQQEKFGLYKEMINGDFALYKNQSEMGFNLYKNQRDLYDTLNDRYANRFNDLDKKVAVMEATRPYQDKLIQSEIKEALNTAIAYIDRKTCRALYGVVGLPAQPTVPVLEGANPFGYVCPIQAQTSSAKQTV